MFEVRWRGRSMGRFRSERTAALCCDEYHRHFAPLAVVEEATGCVVAVFGSSGKRLLFPIATAIAYAALAKVESKDGYNRGYMARGLRFYGRSEPDDWKEGMTDEICGVLRDRALAGRDDTAQKTPRWKF